jgi:hypothetical protein
MSLLDLMNELGSRARYGVGPSEKYQMLLSGSVPGQPKALLPGGADINPDAERYLSNYLGSKQWGQGPANALNGVRYLLDSNDTAYASGLKGAQAGSEGSPLTGLMAMLASAAKGRK